VLAVNTLNYYLKAIVKKVINIFLIGLNVYFWKIELGV